MIKAVAVVAMLVSFTTAAEELQYERDTEGNMKLHMKCGHIAKKAGFTKNIKDLHLENAMHYGRIVWENKSEKEKKVELNYLTYFVTKLEYENGFVDGLYYQKAKELLNTTYLETCQNSQLEFTYKK
jgi:hypothetical protein